MGLTKWAQGKIKEKLEQRRVEKAEQKRYQQEAKQEYWKGYQEQTKKNALERGKRAAGGYRTSSGGKRPQGVTGSIGSFASGMEKGLKGYDGIFGVSGGGSGGFGFGFGLGDEAPKRQAPQTVTRVSPSGHVTISRPYQPERQHEREEPDNFWGSTERSSRKKEKHPYDPF